MKTIACQFGALFLSFLMLGIVASCATTPDEISNNNQLEKEKVRQSKKRTKPLQAKKWTQPAELLMSQPDLVPNSSREKVTRLDVLRGPRISLVAQEADIRTVLLAISKEVQQNIIVDPSIREVVTVDLKQVTLTEALDNLLEPLRLDYEVKGNFVRVFPKRMMTRTFRLNYIISRRQGSSPDSSSSSRYSAGSGWTTTRSRSASRCWSCSCCRRTARGRWTSPCGLFDISWREWMISIV